MMGIIHCRKKKCKRESMIHENIARGSMSTEWNARLLTPPGITESRPRPRSLRLIRWRETSCVESGDESCPRYFPSRAGSSLSMFRQTHPELGPMTFHCRLGPATLPSNVGLRLIDILGRLRDCATALLILGHLDLLDLLAPLSYMTCWDREWLIHASSTAIPLTLSI